MALVRKTTSKKKTIILLSVFLALLIVGGIYLYSLSVGEGVVDVADTATRQLQTTLGELRSVDQKLQPDLEQLLSDVRYKELQSFGKLPIEVGELGRPNPFSHY